MNLSGTISTHPNIKADTTHTHTDSHRHVQRIRYALKQRVPVQLRIDIQASFTNYHTNL